MVDGAIERVRASLAGTYSPPAKSPFDINKDGLFGGIAGLELPVARYEILPGLELSQCFAHVTLPAMMSFAPPEKPGMPHPTPWAALKGHGIDINTQVSLMLGDSPVVFDRLNTLWFLTAMLRMRLPTQILMPVIADRPFTDLPKNTEIANLFPVELHLRQLRTVKCRPLVLADLEWFREHFAAAANLVKNPLFFRVVQTLDSIVNVAHPGSGILIAWASMEALLRPGQKQITDRVCKGLAAHLFQPGPERDRAYPRIVASYLARGGAVHAGDPPETEQLEFAFTLARRAVSTAIEQRALPNIDELLERWKLRT